MYVWCFTFKSVCSISFFFFSRNKYIDIELPSLICTEFPFSLLALHYSPTQLLTCIHKHARARARVPLFLCLFFLSFSPLDPAISRASCASFVLLVPHTRACIYSYARLVSHSRNRTNSLIQLVSRSSVFFFFLFLHNHHRVKPHLPRPAVAQQPPVANKMLYR